MGDPLLCLLGLHRWHIMKREWVATQTLVPTGVGFEFAIKNGIATRPIERACLRCRRHQKRIRKDTPND